MVIELEIQNNSPLCIADALIEREARLCKEEYMVLASRENLRQIGKALLNHVEACERIEQWMERSE